MLSVLSVLSVLSMRASGTRTRQVVQDNICKSKNKYICDTFVTQCSEYKLYTREPDPRSRLIPRRPCSQRVAFRRRGVDIMFLASLAVAGAVAVAPTMCGANWKMSMNIGREPGTAMPPEWAASGARLLLPVPIAFEAGACDAAIRPVNEKLMGERVRRVAPGAASFIDVDGEQQVHISSGGWSETELKDGAVGRERDRPGIYALRFFLDFPGGARRNDVECPPGRVFFTTGYWAGDALAAAEAEFAKVQADCAALEVAMAQAREDAQQGSPLARAAALRNQVTLQDRRVLLNAKLADARAAVPAKERGGAVEGPNGLHVSNVGTVCVKRQGGFLGLREEYHIIGTFTLSPRATKPE